MRHATGLHDRGVVGGRGRGSGCHRGALVDGGGDRPVEPAGHPRRHTGDTTGFVDHEHQPRSRQRGQGLGREREQLRDADQVRRADEGSGERAQAADDRGDDHVDRRLDREVHRPEVGEGVAVDGTADSGHQPSDGGGLEADAGCRDREGPRRLGVVADGDHDAAPRTRAQPVHDRGDDDESDQGHPEVAAGLRRVDPEQFELGPADGGGIAQQETAIEQPRRGHDGEDEAGDPHLDALDPERGQRHERGDERGEDGSDRHPSEEPDLGRRLDGDRRTDSGIGELRERQLAAQARDHDHRGAHHRHRHDARGDEGLAARGDERDGHESDEHRDHTDAGCRPEEAWSTGGDRPLERQAPLPPRLERRPCRSTGQHECQHDRRQDRDLDHPLGVGVGGHDLFDDADDGGGADGDGVVGEARDRRGGQTPDEELRAQRLGSDRTLGRDDERDGEGGDRTRDGPGDHRRRPGRYAGRLRRVVVGSGGADRQARAAIAT